MTVLCKPKFKELSSFSQVGGVLVLRTLWDHFDLSLLLSQSGIFKVRGVATWVLAFLYLVGLIKRSPSVNAVSPLYNQDGLLQQMLGIQKISQSALSRFLTGFSGWDVFNKKRTQRLQDDTDTVLTDGDVLALDDTHAPHPYALHAVRRNGIEYPWSYSIWKKAETQTDKEPSKFDLAWQMLQEVRKQVSCRLWVVMDRWYLSKSFLRQCESANFDWVTKAKSNTKLFRRLIESGTGRERFVPIQPKDLIRQVYPLLKTQTNVHVASVSFQDIYMQMPTEKINHKGRLVKKMKYTPIAAVVGWRVKGESQTTEQHEIVNPDESNDEPSAEYKGAYLLISNRHDAAQEVHGAWLRRWNIEILFRTAKQELGVLNCKSEQDPLWDVSDQQQRSMTQIVTEALRERLKGLRIHQRACVRLVTRRSCRSSR